MFEIITVEASTSIVKTKEHRKNATENDRAENHRASEDQPVVDGHSSAKMRSAPSKENENLKNENLKMSRRDCNVECSFDHPSATKRTSISKLGGISLSFFLSRSQVLCHLHQTFPLWMFSMLFVVYFSQSERLEATEERDNQL